MKPILILLFAMMYMGTPVFVFSQSIYYVDPVHGSDANNGFSIDHAFRTLIRARDVVRTVNQNMTRDIVVNLRGGIHRLNATFALSARDGGTNGHLVIYQPYNCEKPVLSGGVKITKWVLSDAAKNIYKAAVDPSIDSRQLYVNGVRAIRARSTDASGWNESGDGYDCPAEVSKWKNISGVEVVSYSVWKCHRGPIASVSGTHATMAQPYWDYVHVQMDAPAVWVENAYELLDSEGEWYLDRSANAATLYYKPRAGENMATAEVYLPRLQMLLNCQAVNNVEFRGIAFEHATWLLPNTVDGFACLQADARVSGPSDQISTQMPGNISLSYCSNVILNSCLFQHLGSTALQLYRGCKNNSIYNNTFTDISGSAIAIGNLYDSFPTESALVKDNVADNNLILNTAEEFRGCVGILLGYTDHTVLTHNELHGLPYTGISVGWGWSNTVTAAGNNEISYNLIDSSMTLLEDGAAIYALSAQRGTTIHHNYIRNELNRGGALYADEGSSYMHFHHNVLDNIYMWVNLWSLESLEDTVDFNYANTRTNIFSGTDCSTNDNVIVDNDNWPSAAVYIMNSAGRLPVDSCNYTIPDVTALRGLTIYVYPSPTSGLLHVAIEKPLLEDYRIMVYGVQGQLLQTTFQDKSQILTDIDLSRYAAGVYFVRLVSENYSYIRKVFKQ